MSDSQNAGFSFAVSTGVDASVLGVNQLPDVFGIVKGKLQQAATNDVLFAQVFGDKANTAEFQSIRHQWAIGDFSQLPSVQVVSPSTLNGANGAFGTSTQTIYLSEANLTTGSPPQDLLVAKVWVEEIGHFLDAKVGQDTAGDEGEHFADSVFGVQLTTAELSRINNEDDHGSIFVNGQKIDVEFAGSPSDFGINLNSASYSKTDNKFVKANGTGGTYLWCTDFAYGRALEKGLIQQDKGIGGLISGGAGQWDDQAGSWSKQAQANSFVVWDPWTGGTRDGGHVAFVERVNSDGSFVVSECNWGSARMSFNSRTISQKDNPDAFNSAKFIYLGSPVNVNAQPIRVINQAGEVWVQDVSSTIGNAYKLSGALVAYGSPAQAVISQENSNRILVINQQGEVWAHNLSGSTVGSPYKLSGSLVAYSGTPAKSIIADNNKILVINTLGEVWAHDLSGNTVGNAYKLNGALVASAGTPARAIVSENNKILVINTLGEVWAHDLSGNTVGGAYKLSGALVASAGTPAKSISAEDGRILVINTQGEVWAHNLSGNTVGAAYKISGSLVATGGTPVNYFVSDSSALITRPDLIITGQTATSFVTVGSNVSINATTKNTGNAIAGSSNTKYWLSNDTTLDSSDIALGSQTINSLSADASQSASLNFTYDRSWGTGMKYILFQADSGSVVAESNESNNIAYASIFVNPPAKPNPIITGNTSDNGLKFVAAHEGTSLKLYNDAAGNATIGIGHLVHLGAINGTESLEFKNGISQQRALEILKSDLATAENAVKSLVKVALTQYQFDALVSFTFNLGVGNLKTSDLLTRLNKGEYSAVPYELSRWVYGSNKVKLAGLVTRRMDEGKLFSQGIYS